MNKQRQLLSQPLWLTIAALECHNKYLYACSYLIQKYLIFVVQLYLTKTVSENQYLNSFICNGFITIAFKILFAAGEYKCILRQSLCFYRDLFFKQHRVLKCYAIFHSSKMKFFQLLLL